MNLNSSQLLKFSTKYLAMIKILQDLLPGIKVKKHKLKNKNRSKKELFTAHV